MSVRWKLSVLGLASGILALLASGFLSNLDSCLVFDLSSCLVFVNPWVLFLTWGLAFLALGCVFAKRLR